MPKLKKVVDEIVYEVSESGKSINKKVSKAKNTKTKKAKVPKATASKKTKKDPKAKKPKVKVYNISGKFKADAEGNVVKSAKNRGVERVKKMTGTGKPGFMVKVVVHGK